MDMVNGGRQHNMGVLNLLTPAVRCNLCLMAMRLKIFPKGKGFSLPSGLITCFCCLVYFRYAKFKFACIFHPECLHCSPCAMKGNFRFLP